MFIMGIKNMFKGKSKNLKSATIKYDVDSLQLRELVGITIKEIKEKYGDILYLPEDDQNLIAKKGSEKLENDYIVKEEDEIIFIKESGRKG